MENLKYKFVVLGAGISGLTTAYEISKIYPGGVLVLEKEPQVGGLCKTISSNGAFYDLGSHRIHRDSGKRAFELIKEICKGSLIKNTRKGKLRIKGAYVAYPITSIRFLFGIGVVESFLCAVSLFKSIVSQRLFKRSTGPKELNYESYLIRKAGRRAYKLFYEPYARKVWGRPPDSISIDAVKKRVSMMRPARFLQAALAWGFTGIEKNFYYYIDGGIGGFAAGLREKITDNNCKIAGPSHFSAKGMNLVSNLKNWRRQYLLKIWRRSCLRRPESAKRPAK
jgi:protoporphyrinogen oxidase